MNTNTGFQLSDGLMASMLGLLIWISLSAGVHALATGSILLGSIEISLAVAIAFLWKFGDIVEKAKQRHNPALGLLLGFFAFVMILFGAFRLSDLTARSLFTLGELKIPETIRAVSSIVFFVLLVLFLYRLIVAYRIRGRAEGN